MILAMAGTFTCRVIKIVGIVVQKHHEYGLRQRSYLAVRQKCAFYAVGCLKLKSLFKQHSFFSRKKNLSADGCSELSNVHEVRQRPSPRPEIDILDLGASSNAS